MRAEVYYLVGKCWLEVGAGFLRVLALIVPQFRTDSSNKKKRAWIGAHVLFNPFFILKCLWYCRKGGDFRSVVKTKDMLLVLVCL